MAGFSSTFVAEQGPPHHLTVKLLAWYDRHQRVLPWRAVAPDRMDPYKVWLSEIMLQQTTVAAVQDYFLKFIEIWPTVHDLAAASQEDVLKAWAGLGYYARARNLHKCAEKIVTQYNGEFPDTVEKLIKLPGIGAYTAGAIAAIAFDKPHAAVDGNVERVITRLDAMEIPLPQAKPLIKMRTQSLMPRERPGDFAQALMDLGATTCTPKSPNCQLCPWYYDCEARKKNIAATLPLKAEKKIVPTRRGHAYFALNEKREVLLRKRPDNGLLGGMTEVPGSNWVEGTPAKKPPLQAKWKKQQGIVQHTFTHFHLEITVWSAEVTKTKLPDASYRWVPLSKVDAEALPTVMRKIIAHARRRSTG